MSNNPQVAYEFGAFTLFPPEKRLLCDGKAVALAPKVFDTLVLLVENQGRLIQKEELLQALWPDSFVEEVALAHNVSQLRKALRDTTEQPRFIETVPKRGYRFIAAVRHGGTLAAQVAAPAQGGILPSMIQNFRSMRPAVRALCAAMLVLVAGAAAYVYLPRIGRTASGDFPAIHSLAVLPLENLSGDKEQEYFADGMTDELITELGKIGALRVISRTSIMQYKAMRKPLSDIAGKLNADAVVEGTVLRSGNRVRITAQLVRAATEKHLWAESYEGDLNDVLTLQRNVARGIAREIRIKLSPQEQRILAAVRPVNPKAQVAYLKGLFFQNKQTPEALDKSVEFFAEAIKRWLAHVWYAGLLSQTGRFDEAINLDMRARELDPVSVNSSTLLGRDLYRARRYDDAIKACQEGLELDPDDVLALWFQARAKEANHQLPDAIRELEKAVSLSDGPIYRALLANAYASAGQRGKALDILEQLKALSKQRYVSPIDMAVVYMGLGDRNSVFQWFEKAYQERAARIQEVSEPLFDSLRSDPRFPGLMRRVGLSL